eukprot:scaffold119425_cov69-Phaeocystis_antarctica.AAC.2
MHNSRAVGGTLDVGLHRCRNAATHAAAIHRRRLARGTSVRRRRTRRSARSDLAGVRMAPPCCPAGGACEAAVDSALSRPAPASRGRPGGRAAGVCALALRSRVARRACPVLLPAGRR